MEAETIAQLILMLGQATAQAITLAQQAKATASIEDQTKLDAAIATSMAGANAALNQAETDLDKAAVT